MKKVFTFLALQTVLWSTAFAQNAILKGKITDKQSGEALPGAILKVTGSDGGHVSDLNGAYELTVKPGKQEFTISYLGYALLKETYELQEGETKVVNFQLSSSTIGLDGVVITGDLQGQAKALNQQKSADNIKNVISADQIGRFPDPNAAEALQRVPGVNIERDQGEGRYVFIRGLAPKFTNVSVNGEQIPSPESDVRFVALDAIPADQLASMEVSKSLTPDMDGDAIGGSVNLITRTAQSNKWKLSGSMVGGYNALMKKPNIQGSLMAGKRFGKKEQFGVLLNSSYYHNDLGSDNWERDLGGTVSNGDDVFELRDYQLTRTRTGLSATFDYKFHPLHELYLKTLYTKFTDREWRRATAFVSEDGEIEKGTKDRFEEQGITNFNLGGKSNFKKLKLDYQTSYSVASQNTPYDYQTSFKASLPSTVDFSSVDFPKINAPGYLDNTNYAFDKLEIGNSYAEDINITGKINLEIPYKIKESEGSVKFGGKYRTKTKTYTINQTAYEDLGGIPGLKDFEGGLLDNNFLGGNYQLSLNPHVTSVVNYFNTHAENFEMQVEDKNIDEALEAYEATENVTAAYVMAKQQIKKLMILGGVRYEKTVVTYKSKEAIIAPNGDLQSIGNINGGTDYDFILPQLHLKYSLKENTILRGAATFSYARPNFSEIVPAQEANLEDLQVTKGNAQLVPVSAFNSDVMAEHYFAKDFGIVSGGLFYKQLTNFIYPKTNFAVPYLNNNALLVNVTQAQNGEAVSIFGTEIAYQHKLNFLPRALKGLSVYLNYTYTQSKAVIQSRKADGSNPDITETITLPGQSTHVGNAALFYEYKGFSIRTALNFNGQYLKEVGNSKEMDLYVKSRAQLDITAGYTLKKKYRFFVEFMNLTNQPFETFQGNQDMMVQREFYSTWSRAGIKVDL